MTAFTGEFFKAAARRLGWNSKKNDSPNEALARPAVRGALVLMAADSVKKKVAPRLEKYLRDSTKVDPAIVLVVLSAAARSNAPRLFAAFRQRLARPRTPQQRDHMLRALAEFSAPELVDQYLKMTLSDGLRAQDAWKPYVWLLANPQAQERTWRFLRANWTKLVAKIGPRGATRIIAATGHLTSPRKRQEVERFFRDPANEVQMAKKTLEQTLAGIDHGIRFRAAQRRPFERWAGR